MAHRNCYCCKHSGGSKMDVDSALNELGMLSTVTNSRLQYLNEQKRTASDTCLKNLASSSKPESTKFQVIRLDPKYVAGLSMDSKPQQIWIPIKKDSSVKSNSSACSTSDVSETFEFGTKYREMNSSEEAHQNRRRLVRMSRLRAGRYKRFQKPYEVPWRFNQSLPETELHLMEEKDGSHSKSNSSSPVKSSSETRITRSRSLGNLDFSKLIIADFRGNNDSEPREGEEMEKVSHHLENLNMNDGV